MPAFHMVHKNVGQLGVVMLTYCHGFPSSRFALDLVEVFFQIVHTRWPLLNPEDFRARLGLHNTSASGKVNLPTHPLAHSDTGLSGPSYGTSTHGYPSPPPTGASAPLHPAIVAAVIAWGAKFSEHSLLVADRRKNGGQGRLPKILINRARDVAEVLKVHRVPTPEHVLVGLLLEPLQSREC
jgi:hypothetical protein